MQEQLSATHREVENADNAGAIIFVRVGVWTAS